MQLSWDSVKKWRYKVLSPKVAKVHAATRIHPRSQSPNRMFWECVQRFTDFVIQATCTDPTPVTCQVTIVLFIWHLFNKEMKEQEAGAKTIQTLRHTMALL